LRKKAAIKGNPEAGSGFAEWEAFQRILAPRFSLVIVSRQAFNGVVYYGNPAGQSRLCFYLVDDHYHVITDLKKFMGTDYVCPHCLKKGGNMAAHKCHLTCYYCKRKGVCEKTRVKRCDKCGIVYPNDECYRVHVERLCKKRKLCMDCGASTLVGSRHMCGYKYCNVCVDYLPVDHQCYMKPLVRKDSELNPVRYVFYDFECATRESGEHVPVLCVAHLVCSLCMEEPITDTECCVCGRRELVFEGENTARDFGDFVFSGKKESYTCIAHNSSGYDVHFILRHCHNAGVKPRLTVTGKKIMCLEASGNRFIDSLNFIPMALSKLPKAFGLRELAKGYFPHRFNVPENSDYVGCFPPSHYFSPEQMSPEAAREFHVWYESQKTLKFDMKAELLKYCRSDVDILQRCCGVFRNLFVKYTGLEPFTKSITIASATNRVYRTCYLEPGEIALLPPHGYYPGKQSSQAVCWLELVSKARGIHIRHYGNGGEVRVEGRYVDGVGPGNELFFYHGCFFHGCPRCYRSQETVQPLSGLTFRELYMRTEAHMAYLREKGYRVIEKWECDFKPLIEKSPQVKALLSRCSKIDPLKPRDAFYGGRVNAIRLYAKAPEAESIRYVDFTSLYPYVNKYTRYPVEKPTVYQGADIPEKVEGLVKCKVLPPRDLFHPLLPYRCRKKLLFPLCRTCAETAFQGNCPHERIDDRALTGTWVTSELEKAVSLGYVIIERYEAWHFERTKQYDPVTKTGGLWAPFIDVWIKLKQEASGYPSWAKTDVDKSRYVEEYYRHEGIQLDPDKIERNEGLRSLSKLVVNSHWGKSAQRSGKTQVSYVSEHSELVKMMNDDTVQISDVRYVNDEYVIMHWNHQEEFEESLPHVNVVLAAYTTAAARLKLYEVLEMLGERVLYFDTDSVIYHHKEGESNPELGDYLGELKDETEGVPIREFVGCGAKNYAYRMDNGTSVCKIRGFTLSNQTSQLLNFDSLSRIVRGGFTETIDTRNPFNIVRDSSGKLYTKSLDKRYSLVYDKRYVGADGVSTYPFGWRGSGGTFSSNHEIC